MHKRYDLCENNGICYVNGSGLPACMCVEDYSGEVCDKYEPEGPGSNQTVIIAAVTSVVALLIIGIIITVICVCKDRKRNNPLLYEK